MSTVPAGIIWDGQASRFLDQLVDRDIGYLDVQLAVEALIDAGLHDEVTVTFDVEGRTVHWHRMPPSQPRLRALDVFTSLEQSGAIHVIHIRFASGRA